MDLGFFHVLHILTAQYRQLTQVQKKRTLSWKVISLAKHLPTCDFRKFLHYLLLGFALGDGSNKQSIIGHRDTNTNVFARADLAVVTLKERDRTSVYFSSR